MLKFPTLKYTFSFNSWIQRTVESWRILVFVNRVLWYQVQLLAHLFTWPLSCSQAVTIIRWMFTLSVFCFGIFAPVVCACLVHTNSVQAKISYGILSGKVYARRGSLISMMNVGIWWSSVGQGIQLVDLCSVIFNLVSEQSKNVSRYGMHKRDNHDRTVLGHEPPILQHILPTSHPNTSCKYHYRNHPIDFINLMTILSYFSIIYIINLW